MNQSNNPYVWQDECLEGWVNYLGQFFLACCCVGSGKTIMGIKVLKKELESGRCNFAIILAPTGDVCDSWIEKAWEHKGVHNGIRLTKYRQNRSNYKEYDGVVMTYAMFAKHSHDIQNLLVDKHKTLVILDEIHHLADENQWGPKAKRAFDKAVKILGLTGTAFRSKGRIPWVPEKDGKLDIDAPGCFNRPYRKCLSAGIVRRAIFPHVGGTASWKDEKGIQTADLDDDDLNAEDISKAYLTLLGAPDSNGYRNEDFVLEAIKKGLEKLARCKDTHSNAGMIIFCLDIEHARWIEGICRRSAAEGGFNLKMSLIVSKDGQEAKERLKDFKQPFSKDDCIGAVLMVTEGTDIVRLRVAVYLTNVMSRLRWWQALGRILRKIEGASFDEEAFWIQANHPNLLRYAQEVMKDIEAVILEQNNPLEPGEPGNKKVSVFEPIAAIPKAASTILTEDEGTKTLEIKYSECLHKLHIQTGISEIHAEALVATGLLKRDEIIAKFSNQPSQQYTHTQKEQETEEHPDVRKAKLRERINELGREAVKLRSSIEPTFADDMKKHQWPHAYFKNKTGIQKEQVLLSEEELQLKLKHMESLVSEWRKKAAFNPAYKGKP